MSDDHSKPDLDLIQKVQRARMLHDADARPSEITAVYWIEAKSQAETTKPPTSRTGEWQIETTLAQADALWAQVRQATEVGQLGYKSKVSTASHSGVKGAEDRLIAVRTYDADDLTDVGRVKAALVALGIDAKSLRYERDKAE